MINFYRIKNKQIIEVLEVTKEDPMWIKLTNPTSNEIEYIEKQYRIPRDYLTGSLDEDEIARTDNLFSDNNEKLLSFTYPIKNMKVDNLYKTRLISMILVNDNIITVSLDELEFLEDISKGNLTYMKSISNNIDLIFEIVWKINKLFLSYLHEIKIEQEEISENLLKTTDSKTLVKQANLIKSTIYFDYALEANNKIIEKMSELIDRKDNKYRRIIKALEIENKQALIRNGQEKEIIENLSDVNSSIISNNLNIVMKMMTAATIMLTIPTIISGIWGMNIEIPFMDHDKAFLIVSIITGLLVYLVYRLLKKKGFM